METQQNQSQPQAQIQQQQSFDVKGTLSKLDKYNNTLLTAILVGIGVISCIFYIVPIFDLNIMQRPIGFSLSALAAFGSLAKTIYQFSLDSNAGPVANIGYIAFSLIFSLTTVLLPLIKQTKKYAGFACIPALANCIIFFMVYNAFSPSNPNSSSSSIFRNSNAFLSINFFGYVYVIGQIAAILVGALILYRNNEAKKAAVGTAATMNAYQISVQSQPVGVPQYFAANPAPAAPTSAVPSSAMSAQSQATEAQPPQQATLQAQFCPKCGNKLEPGTKFCGNCGASIN